jgi:predicted RNA-binding Zn-ribbon protein involved in translation (DUF1610 family)
MKYILSVLLVAYAFVCYSASYPEIIEKVLNRKIANDGKKWQMDCWREIKWLSVSPTVILIGVERNTKDPHPFVEEKTPGKFQLFVIAHDKSDGIIKSPGFYTYISLSELLAMNRRAKIFDDLKKEYNITYEDVKKLSSNARSFRYHTKETELNFQKDEKWKDTLSVLEISLEKELPKSLKVLNAEEEPSAQINLDGGLVIIRNFSIYDNQLEGIMYDKKARAFNIEITPVRKVDLTIEKFEICFFKINDIEHLETKSFSILQYPIIWEMRFQNNRLQLNHHRMVSHRLMSPQSKNNSAVDLSLNNAIITKSDGKYFYYRKKCKSCGFVSPQVTGSTFPKTYFSCKSKFICPKCGITTDVSIQKNR